MAELGELDGSLHALCAGERRAAGPTLERLRLPAATPARHARLAWLLVPLAAAAGLAAMTLRTDTDTGPKPRISPWEQGSSSA